MSLADRITKPEASESNADAVEESATTLQTPAAPPPSEAPKPSSSWADEAEDDPTRNDAAATTSKVEVEKDVSGVGEAQTDGASERLGGEVGVIEPSYEVEIKLADIQANPNDPLYSIKSFDELGL